ncbi:hypothetical protein J8281_14290 [Aquimarina sp. U1-2]|uniref:hypothetical protein n=1 Tax=Aquimarina sp. U1-2 TaxID=2823141 RepID=UPI001AEC7D6D|nr:hypothetical protein [Aquimarina sp. U1-2]MBP2833361.1 hypothetical protein [Aquimarina sp. U1-2]
MKKLLRNERYMHRLSLLCVSRASSFNAAAKLLILSLLLCTSCGSSDTHTQENSIIGKWKLQQEYSNEGRDTPLKEFPLSQCDKETTLEVLDTGIFVEKNYYEDSSIGGECGKDSQDTRGGWKKSSPNTYLFTYDKSNPLLLRRSVVNVVRGDLIVNVTYNDRDLGPNTKVKFIYAKVQ